MRPSPPAASAPRDRALLLLILAVAAFLRLWRLDLMEFKGDEAQACRLALQTVAAIRGQAGPGESLPLVGLMASVGVPNPPLFIYLLALPFFLSASPLLAAGTIALSNVAAVGLCYLAGRRYFSRFVGLSAAALYAVAPWAVLFSRKIWAQDLLPVFAGGFLLAAHAFLVDRRPRALLWLLLLAAAAVQLHFSALILGGVLAGLLCAGRDVVRLRWLALGLALGLFLYLPYAVHFLATHGAEFTRLGARREAWDRLVPAAERLRWAFRYPGAVAGADGTADLIGSQPAWAGPLAVVAGLGALAGLLGLAGRERGTPRAPARWLLVGWFVLPTLALAATGIVPFIHYFIILYPVVFLGLAAALEWLRVRARYAALALLAAVLGAYACLDIAAGGFVAGRGGAPGDYGVAYAHQAAAMDYVAARTAGPRPLLFDGAHPGAAVAPEYRFLLEQALRARAAPAAAPHGFVLLDLSKSALTPAGLAAIGRLPRRDFGPLTLVEVPVTAAPPAP